MKSFILFIILSFTFFSSPDLKESQSVNGETKTTAFKILKEKCNVCHVQKNRNRVFTLDNMNKNSRRIYRQVFLWKRMPKGNDNNLTTEEYNQLKNWLASINLN